MGYASIRATGSYLPGVSVPNSAFAELVETSDEWIRSRSGIGNRHITQGENTSELAAKAAQAILQNAGISAEEIELIIVATVSPDYATPSVACQVQAAIGAVHAVAFDINAACSGFVYAFSMADKLIGSGAYQNALVIGSEVLSKLLDFTDRTTCILFGDGAGGVLLTASETPGLLAEELGSDGSLGHVLTARASPAVNPFSSAEPALPSYIQMDGRAVFDFATRRMPKCIRVVLEKAEFLPEDITYVIPHQANARIVEVFSRKLKIPMEKFYMNLERYGNTSSASIPIALDEMCKKGLLSAGDTLLLAGFGGGLTWGCLLIRLSEALKQ